MRTFLAIDIPDSIKDNIFKYLEEKDLSNIDGVKYVKKPNLHVTLHFLGEQEREEISEKLRFIKELRKKNIPEDLNFNVQDTGVFPSYKNPRVFWIGINDTGGKIDELYRESARRLMDMEIIESRRRRFTPHITIGRNKKKRTLPLKGLKSPEFGSFNIKYITLYKSILKPDGPVYEEVERF